MEADRFNYETTIMHEMHAWPPIHRRTSREERRRRGLVSLHYKYITDNAGTPAISPTTYTWDTAFDPNSNRTRRRLFFYGTNKALAFGQEPVPLYTPTKWAQGVR